MNQDSINYKKVEEAIAYLSGNFKDQPSLEMVAQQVHTSPQHFQRIFTEWAGKQSELAQFAETWHFARRHHNPDTTVACIEKIFNRRQSDKIHLLVQGTNFQLKVWEALLKIPQGAVSTYQHIANAIHNSKAVRAVGTAIGNNPIAYLIPCHRVIKARGEIGQYHWGDARKKALIGWEMAQDVRRKPL